MSKHVSWDFENTPMANLWCRSYSQYVEEADYSQLQPEGDYSLYSNHVEPSPRQPRWAARKTPTPPQKKYNFIEVFF